MQIPQVMFSILTAASTVGVIIQAGVLIGMYIVVRKAIHETRELSGQLKQHLLPIITITRSLIEDVFPKVKIATKNLVEVRTTVRSQTAHINKVVSEVTGMAPIQSTRLRVRQIAGVLNGLRVGLAAFRK